MNWTQFLDRGSGGGLWVEPESSVQHSSALVLSRVRPRPQHCLMTSLMTSLMMSLRVFQLFEYDDVNDTASASSGVFPPFDLQEVTWQRLRLSGGDALLCGTSAAFGNGSLCLQV